MIRHDGDTRMSTKRRVVIGIKLAVPTNGSNADTAVYSPSVAVRVQ